nr:potassium voltage-gated channel subfamily KQT member 1 [Biomphalaria glabrata]
MKKRNSGESNIQLSMTENRLDQTIGKPAYYGNIRDKEKLTLCSRIGRIETQINKMDLKLDQTIVLLNILVHQQKHPSPSEDTSPETLENS